MNNSISLFINFNMKKLAIVGATGLVGQTVLGVLEGKKLLDEFDIYLLVSNNSAGKVLIFEGRHYPLYELNENVISLKFDYAIFVTSEDVSRGWVEKFSKTGTVVIDNSSAFRMEDGVPLVVPEINFSDIKESDKIIANPNCSTIQLVVVLDRLKKLYDIDSVIVSSYQSVSGAGREALNDLENHKTDYFSCGIENNFIPQIGSMKENGFCSEENKIMNETKKILHAGFDVIATTVRVPIAFCHGESVYVKFKSKVELEKIKEALMCDWISLSDDLFYPRDCAGSDLTYVCRLRKYSDREILFFVIADNLRRGAAFNAVEILKRLEDNNKNLRTSS